MKETRELQAVINRMGQFTSREDLKIRAQKFGINIDLIDNVV
jgi:hypothetical protein